MMLEKYKKSVYKVAAQINRSRAKLYLLNAYYVVPIILPIAVGLFLNESGINSSVLDPGVILMYTGICLLLALIGIFFIRFKCNIQRLVWIDLSFDEKIKNNITKIKIPITVFLSALWFRIKVFLIYELLSWLFICASLASFIVFMEYLDKIGLYQYSLYVSFSATTVLLCFSSWYAYYLYWYKIRYIWFLFIDHYSHKGVLFWEIVDEMNKLNKISKTSEYFDNLKEDFGSASVYKIQNTVSSLLRDRVPLNFYVDSTTKKYTNNLFSSIFFRDRLIVSEVSRYTTLLTKYLLYKAARKIKYNEEQYANDELYSLL